MNNLEIFIAVAYGILLLLIIVQCVVMYNKKKEIDNLVKRSKSSEAELEKYRIREERPLPMVKDIDYLILKEEVRRYKPPYKVGQKVMYDDEGSVKIGYIKSVRTKHFKIDEKEVVVKHAYEIGSKFYTDIIDVVKEIEK